jgi:hypothetical protein
MKKNRVVFLLKYVIIIYYDINKVTTIFWRKRDKLINIYQYMYIYVRVRVRVRVRVCVCVKMVMKYNP